MDGKEGKGFKEWVLFGYIQRTSLKGIDAPEHKNRVSTYLIQSAQFKCCVNKEYRQC